jgi:lipoprotein-anchoring transpeptidase ErfK/SrfK
LGQQAATLRPARVGEVSEVAQAKVASVAVYQTPAAGKPWKTLRHPLPSKAPLVFLVQEEKGDWLRVLVPVRPNQSQGWIRRKDVTLSQHEYRITISISKHELTLYKGSNVVMREQVGLGKETTPTPGGVFYTKELLRPPKPDGAYGPYAYGLSGFSPVLNEFLGGDGEIGIHGTNDPAGIGKDVSHGCIRMRNEAITKLAATLPLGVPVQIMG